MSRSWRCLRISSSPDLVDIPVCTETGFDAFCVIFRAPPVVPELSASCSWGALDDEEFFVIEGSGVAPGVSPSCQATSACQLILSVCGQTHPSERSVQNNNSNNNKTQQDTTRLNTHHTPHHTPHTTTHTTHTTHTTTIHNKTQPNTTKHTKTQQDTTKHHKTQNTNTNANTNTNTITNTNTHTRTHTRNSSRWWWHGPLAVHCSAREACCTLVFHHVCRSGPSTFGGCVPTRIKTSRCDARHATYTTEAHTIRTTHDYTTHDTMRQHITTLRRDQTRHDGQTQHNTTQYTTSYYTAHHDATEHHMTQHDTTEQHAAPQSANRHSGCCCRDGGASLLCGYCVVRSLGPGLEGRTHTPYFKACRQGMMEVLGGCDEGRARSCECRYKEARVPSRSGEKW